MITNRYFALILAMAFAANLASCSKEKAEQPKAENSSCAEWYKETDPTRKAELAKSCPHAGPAFKPSKPTGF